MPVEQRKRIGAECGEQERLKDRQAGFAATCPKQCGKEGQRQHDNKQSGNAAAMVSATLGKAKVLGLVVDKQETNTKILTPPVFNFKPVSPKEMTDDELKTELKKYGIDIDNVNKPK